MVGFGFNGSYFLVAILAILGLSQIGVDAVVNECMICGYPKHSVEDGLYPKEDPKGELCRRPEQNTQKAMKLYSQPCATIGHFKDHLEKSRGYKPPPKSSAGFVFKPKWERDSDPKAEKPKWVKDPNYRTVCKKTYVTFSSEDVPGTDAWAKLESNKEDNTKFERLIRYCGWEPSRDEHDKEITYPIQLQPFGNSASLKIVETTNACDNSDNCNAAQGLKVKTGMILLSVIALFLTSFNA